RTVVPRPRSALFPYTTLFRSSYLVPYAARTFFNSLAFQARLLGYEPDTDITVLLADFEDYGNAGVSVVPRNTMLVQVAPLSFALDRKSTRLNSSHVKISYAVF